MFLSDVLNLLLYTFALLKEKCGRVTPVWLSNQLHLEVNVCQKSDVKRGALQLMLNRVVLVWSSLSFE